ncbi:MAG: nucleotide exchange factor GrpE [Synergistaceae bacterium]|jgi:molecular chaperone GrpE|nr:nucleotide exchange factor GrpE [Synergistaceae bacterium]
MFGLFTKAEIQEQLRRNVLSGVEKICSAELSSVKDSLASLGDLLNSLAERFSGMEERLSGMEEGEQQAQRQERRRQAALESVLENQNQILEKLQPSPPLEALAALAENLALACLARPADREFSILRGKLADLLTCFGLSLILDEGSLFDPERHEACAALCDRAYPEGSVLEVVRPGFLLEGKVLRYATVVVNRYDAKPRYEEPEDEEPQDEDSPSISSAPLFHRNREAAWEGKLYD